MSTTMTIVGNKLFVVEFTHKKTKNTERFLVCSDSDLSTSGDEILIMNKVVAPTYQFVTEAQK